MKLQELIDGLTALAEEMKYRNFDPTECEVRLWQQPHYPLQQHLSSGVVHMGLHVAPEDIFRSEDDAEENRDAANILYLMEGGPAGSGYGPRVVNDSDSFDLRDI